MTLDQGIPFTLLAFVFVLLIWGRWRYDLIAFGALVVAVMTGGVPTEAAFSGFSHSATVIIALVLIVSRALINAGVIELIGRHLVSASRSRGAHINPHVYRSGRPVRRDEQRGRTRGVDASRLTGGIKSQPEPGAHLDAAFLCVDSRRP